MYKQSPSKKQKFNCVPSTKLDSYCACAMLGHKKHAYYVAKAAWLLLLLAFLGEFFLKTVKSTRKSLLVMGIIF